MGSQWKIDENKWRPAFWSVFAAKAFNVQLFCANPLTRIKKKLYSWMWIKIFFYMATSIVSQGIWSENLHNVHLLEVWQWSKYSKTIFDGGSKISRAGWRREQTTTEVEVKNYYLARILPWKWKKLDPRGASLASFLDTQMNFYVGFKINLKVCKCKIWHPPTPYTLK